MRGRPAALFATSGDPSSCISGGSRAGAVLWATGSGLVEPLAAAVGFHLVSAVEVLVSFGLALAAGAMVFVASDQLIPESRFEPRVKAPSLALPSSTAPR